MAAVSLNLPCVVYFGSISSETNVKTLRFIAVLDFTI